VSGTGMVTHNQGWLSMTLRDRFAYAPRCTACAKVAFAASVGSRDEHQPKQACECCAKSEELWVCLICGHLGCGRYAKGHAKDHATELHHRFCLELASGRIWDYSGDVFVHRRLVQMAAASGGSFDVALPAPATGESSSGVSSSREGAKTSWPGHDDVLAMELDAILASQLDYQRSIYEMRLSEAGLQQAENLQLDRARLEKDEAEHVHLQKEILEAERRQKMLEKQYMLAEKAKAEVEEKVTFAKELNQSLLANRRDIAMRKPGSKKEQEDDALVKRLKARKEQLMHQISSAADP